MNQSHPFSDRGRLCWPQQWLGSEIEFLSLYLCVLQIRTWVSGPLMWREPISSLILSLVNGQLQLSLPFRGCIFRFMLDPEWGPPLQLLSPGESHASGEGLQESTAFLPFIHIFTVNSHASFILINSAGQRDPKSHSCILPPWATLGCSGRSL